MHSIESEFTAVFLTYKDVKEANPDWSDRMISDYMGAKRNLSTVTASIDSILVRLDSLEARVTFLEGTLIVTAVDHTTIGNQTVICTAEVTISLTESPNDKDVVRVKQRNTKITISGNGRNIEGNSELRIRKRNTSTKTGLALIYSKELDEWFVI